MNYYAVGNIRGCYHTFLDLLELMDFKSGQDALVIPGNFIGPGAKLNKLVDLLMLMKTEGDAIPLIGAAELCLLEPSKYEIDRDFVKNYESLLRPNYINWILNLSNHYIYNGYYISNAGINTYKLLKNQSNEDVTANLDKFLKEDLSYLGYKFIISSFFEGDEIVFLNNIINIETNCIGGSKLTAISLDGKESEFAVSQNPKDRSL